MTLIVLLRIGAQSPPELETRRQEPVPLVALARSHSSPS